MSHYRNSDWGLRDMNDLERLAKSNGMVLHKIVSRMCDVTSTSSTAGVDTLVSNSRVCAIVRCDVIRCVVGDDLSSDVLSSDELSSDVISLFVFCYSSTFRLITRSPSFTKISSSQWIT